ncbi:hypothetical protein [Bdellovibrio sp. HCB274]|uniref:hypothetical protein n=1 Tax=Bdellovibrio sp. HCB274 TaxID=3394361 RepID=UPI0039B5B549
MFLRRTFAVFVSMATLLIAMPSVAQHRDMRGEQDLQRRVYQLESTVYQLSQRLERLEYGTPEQSRGWVCIVKDPTWGKVYKGKAESRVEASAAATNACVTGSGFAMNCRAEPTCERL